MDRKAFDTSNDSFGSSSRHSAAFVGTSATYVHIHSIPFVSIDEAWPTSLIDTLTLEDGGLCVDSILQALLHGDYGVVVRDAEGVEIASRSCLQLDLSIYGMVARKYFRDKPEKLMIQIDLRRSQDPLKLCTKSNHSEHADSHQKLLQERGMQSTMTNAIVRRFNHALGSDDFQLTPISRGVTDDFHLMEVFRDRLQSLLVQNEKKRQWAGLEGNGRSMCLRQQVCLG